LLFKNKSIILKNPDKNKSYELLFLQMPRVQFIGQVSQSFGNTLPELCSKLKNFGIGRMFIRTSQDQKKGKIIPSQYYIYSVLIL
jgi:hypothetical protein